MVEQIWQNKSAYSDARIESRSVFALTRYDRSKPALPYNLLFLTREEADAHDRSTRATGSIPDPGHIPDTARADAITKILKAEERAWKTSVVRQ